MCDTAKGELQENPFVSMDREGRVSALGIEILADVGYFSLPFSGYVLTTFEPSVHADFSYTTTINCNKHLSNCGLWK